MYSCQESVNITVIQDGTGKHQHSTGVKRELRKSLNGLKWHIEEEPNATPSQGLKRIIHHDEEVLLFRPEIQ